ncbi:hypothetical protein C4553_01895 [Candidatus Parcubacteria bacterium]|nr:MAG: hypothetical protein C4553_01895 [Candidatus Parcubacteria bacterium]
MLTTIVIIITLAVLILVHEWGHYVAAKKSGVKVEEFGFGFPPRLFGKRNKEGVLFSFNLIPLGGFVKIFGENDSEQKEPGSFAAQPARKRALILAAGVLMNVLLAYLLLTAVQVVGVQSGFEGELPPGASNPMITVIDVAKGSPAELAGIQAGDGILQIESQGQIFLTSEALGRKDALTEFRNFIEAQAGKEIVLQIRRGNDELVVSATPRIDPPLGEGALGIGMLKTALIRTPWYKAPWEGLKLTGRLLSVFIGAIGGIIKEAFTTGTLSESLTGPVGIVKITAQTVSLGFVFILQLVAILSLNIALINILPFPALDGGRLLFLAIEKLRGKPLKREVEQWANAFGFFLLILLMIFVTIKDINRFF